MKVATTKSKNSESFYITKSFVNGEGKSTSKIIRKLGTLKDLSAQLGTDRDGVMAWAKEQARIETEKYKMQNQAKTVLIPFHADRALDYHQQKLFKGAIFSLRLFIINWALTGSAEKSGTNTSSIMISTRFCRILFTPESWNPAASSLLTAQRWIFWSLPLIRNMMSTGPWMSSPRNAI